MNNIEHISQLEYLQARLSTALGVKATSSEASNSATHREAHSLKTTIILEITQSMPIKTPNSGQITGYNITATPILQLDSSLTSAQHLTNTQPLQFKTDKPYTTGELFAAMATQIDPTATLKVKPHLLALTTKVQAQLTQIQVDLNQQLKLGSSAQTAVDLHQTSRHYFMPSLRLLEALEPQQTNLKHLQKLVQTSQNFRLPLDWLSQQNFNFEASAALPKWVSQIPFMAQRNLQNLNLLLLQNALSDFQLQQAGTNATAGQYNEVTIPIHLTPRQLQTANDRFQRLQAMPTSKGTPLPTQATNLSTLEALQSWVSVQNQWLTSPETLTQRLPQILQILNAIQPAGTNFTGLSAVHYQLIHLWPTYAKIENLLRQLEQSMQASFTASYQSKSTRLQKLMGFILQETLPEDRHKTLQALLIRTGIATLEDSTQNLIKELPANEGKTLQFAMPYGESAPLSRWLEVSIQPEQKQPDQNFQAGAKITLDFETNVFGFIRVQLQFPKGFYNPKCITDVFLEKSSFIPAFKAHETELLGHLQKIGLQIDNFAWHQGRPETPASAPRIPKFQIDDYV